VEVDLLVGRVEQPDALDRRLRGEVLIDLGPHPPL
jgi:hypothetical protein